jgi:hypothetical protein
VEVVATRSHKVRSGYQRVVMPLNELTKGNDAILLQAVAVIGTTPRQGRCAIRLGRAQLVNVYRQAP